MEWEGELKAICQCLIANFFSFSSPEFWSNTAGCEGTPRLEQMKARSQQIFYPPAGSD